MKERPIIFTELIPKILDGTKTTTRRTQGLDEINKNPDRWDYMRTNNNGDALFWVVGDDPEPDIEKRTKLVRCPYGQVGDRLWVRETFFINDQLWVEDHYEPDDTPVYKADKLNPDIFKGVWKPSIHMPRWASRITLEITEVRVERLQEITEGDVTQEGLSYRQSTNEFPIGSIPANYQWYWGFPTLSWNGGIDYVYTGNHKEAFERLWDSLNAKRGYGWETNCWVWVIGFRRLNEH